MISHFQQILYELSILLVVMYSAPASSQDSVQNRLQAPDKSSTIKPFEEYGAGQHLFLNFYQNWLSPVKGGNKCPMYPSCSQYAKIAWQSLPWYKAYPLIFERLLGCGKALQLYPTIQINHQIYCYDPVVTREALSVPELSSDTTQSIFDSKNSSSENGFRPDQGFADYLFNTGEYYRAITEYRRVLYDYPDSTQKLSLLRNIGRCYLQGQDYEGYIRFFKLNNQLFKTNSEIPAEMELYLSQSYYHLKNYRQAISVLEWSRIQATDSIFNARQLCLGVAYARLFDWHTSIKKMEFIQPKSPLKVTAQRLSLSWQNYPKLPYRNPMWAATFSAIIPGAGYLYADQRRTAVTALLVNGFLAWAIRDAIHEKQYGLTAAAIFFGVGWYVGNIKGSLEAAKNFNSYIRHQFINKLLEKEQLEEYIIDQAR